MEWSGRRINVKSAYFLIIEPCVCLPELFECRDYWFSFRGFAVTSHA